MMYVIQLEHILQIQVIYIESSPSAHIPNPAILPSVLQHAPIASWGVPCDHLTDEEKTGVGLQVILHDLWAQPELAAAAV